MKKYQVYAERQLFVGYYIDIEANSKKEACDKVKMQLHAEELSDYVNELSPINIGDEYGIKIFNVIEEKEKLKVKKALVNPITRELRVITDNGFVEHTFTELDEWYGLYRDGHSFDFHFHYDEEFSLSVYVDEDYTQSHPDIDVVVTFFPFDKLN